MRIAILVLSCTPFLAACGNCTLALVHDSLMIRLVHDDGRALEPVSGVITVGGDERSFDCTDFDGSSFGDRLYCEGSMISVFDNFGTATGLDVTDGFFDRSGGFYFGTGSPEVEIDEPNGNGCGERYEVTVRVSVDRVDPL